MHEALVGPLAAPLVAVMSVAAGGALGLLFYAGLWWTVRRAASFRRPAFGVMASLLLRMSVTLVGFYLVAGGELARLLLCLTGFVLARGVVTWLTRLPFAAKPSGALCAATGARHAP